MLLSKQQSPCPLAKLCTHHTPLPVPLHSFKICFWEASRQRPPPAPRAA